MCNTFYALRRLVREEVEMVFGLGALVLFLLGFGSICPSHLLIWFVLGWTAYVVAYAASSEPTGLGGQIRSEYERFKDGLWTMAYCFGWYVVVRIVNVKDLWACVVFAAFTVTLLSTTCQLLRRQLRDAVVTGCYVSARTQLRIKQVWGAWERLTGG